MLKKKILMDDGFNPELVGDALFDGRLEIPVLAKPDRIIIPEGMIPFSCRKKSTSHKEFLVFYEHDYNFAQILKNPEELVREFSEFPGIVTPDNSVYVDSPLTVQIANVYRNRAIGHFYQRKGIYVIPNVRWGDERSYTKCILPEKFAFLGVPKDSIVCIGTYGACKSPEEKYHMREGLKAMLDELVPQTVLVYGAMPDVIFNGLLERTHFIQYPDWISLKKGKVCNFGDF